MTRVGRHGGEPQDRHEEVYAQDREDVVGGAEGGKFLGEEDVG